MSSENPVPVSWHELQKVLRESTKEEEVQALIQQEKAGANRARWLIRMMGRYRVLRNERENNELLGE